MLRTGFVLILVGLMSVAPVLADSGNAQSPPATKSRSTGKRVAWTVLGAAAGFGAGVFLGLNKFDDAINSDRKVWTTAIVGAAAGGVTAALLSRNVGSTARVPGVASRARSAAVPSVSWSSALGGTGGVTPLSRRPPPE
jgi:hypothetical protein